MHGPWQSSFAQCSQISPNILFGWLPNHSVTFFSKCSVQGASFLSSRGVSKCLMNDTCGCLACGTFGSPVHLTAHVAIGSRNSLSLMMSSACSLKIRRLDTTGNFDTVLSGENNTSWCCPVELLPFLTCGPEHSPARWPTWSTLIAVCCSSNKLEMSLKDFHQVDLGWNPQLIEFLPWPNNENPLRTCKSSSGATSMQVRHSLIGLQCENGVAMSRFSFQSCTRGPWKCCFRPITLC